MSFVRTVTTSVATCAVAASLLAPRVVAQQPTTPVAVISVAPVGDLLQETAYLLQAANVPEVSGVATMLGNQYTQGVDQNRPIAVSVTLEGQMPSALVCIPMSNRERFFDALAGIGVEPDEIGDGLFEVSANGQVLYAKDSGEWLYVGQTEDALASVPADPATLVGKLPDHYSLAVQLNVQSVPEPLKEMAIQQLQMGFERGMAEQGGQSDEEREAARKAGEAQIAQIRQFLTETDRITIGWKIDKDNQQTFVDTAAQFIDGSKSASQVAALEGMTTKFAAFKLPYSSAHMRVTSQVGSEEEKELAKQNIQNSVRQGITSIERSDAPPELQEALIGAINGLVKVVSDTIDEGKFDGASSLSVADDTLRVLMGGSVADGNAVGAELKKVLGSLPDAEDAPKAEFDYDNYEGYSLHRIRVPVKIADPAARSVFGEELLLTAATAEKAFILALDNTGDEVVRTAIDKLNSATETDATPVEGVVQLEQILRFAQSISPNPIVEKAVQTVSQHAGNDKVQMNATLIPRGVKYRLSIDEGVLRTIGAAAKGGGGGGF